MNRLLSLLFLALPGTLLAQAPIYKNFEVDQEAMPRGGLSTFNSFLKANLRKPTGASAQGIGGTVMISGVVEPDGHVSDATVLRSLRPDLDREALRVFRQFNAWQPARKDNQAVRQTVSTRIQFPPNTPFAFADGRQTLYYTAAGELATDSSLAVSKVVSPLDSLGLPSGDLTVYSRKRKSWDAGKSIQLVREKITISPAPMLGEHLPASDPKPGTLLGYKTALDTWFGTVYTLNQAGHLYEETIYNDKGYPSGERTLYHDNGVVAKQVMLDEQYEQTTTWYASGQLREIRSRVRKAPLTPGPQPADRVLVFWAPDGRQTVVNGTGTAVYETEEAGKAGAEPVRFTEQGQFVNQLRQGVWTGQTSDGSYAFRETYVDGMLQAGAAYRPGKDSIRYTTPVQQPEFTGGMNGLGQFLAQNLRYPADAQRAGQQGRVVVGFVVCEDGTLCDYTVQKGLSPSIDEEAVRVVKAMSGRWTPGYQRGEAVRVKYNLPINFSLY